MKQDKTTVWTERLILRLPQENDFEAYAAIWADPEVVRYIGAVPRSRARCRDAWEKNLTSWKTQGYGNWMIEGRESAALIGQV
ncbi:GNAT family N-acetyltransferase, partial [Halocynthiibacter sp.]|uniref:GNAT family N-acetyltransferase n=1 Tax=Halocynthiibacter sp. TaxID=1979210 RepID=UPI003C3672D9